MDVPKSASWLPKAVNESKPKKSFASAASTNEVKRDRKSQGVGILRHAPKLVQKETASSQNKQSVIQNKIEDISKISWPELPKPGSFHKYGKKSKSSTVPSPKIDLKKDNLECVEEDNPTSKINETSQSLTSNRDVPKNDVECSPVVERPTESTENCSIKIVKPDENVAPSESQEKNMCNSEVNVIKPEEKESDTGHNVNKDVSADKSPDCARGAISDQKIKKKTKAGREERRRAREEETRRRMLAPKGQRVRLVSQQVLDALVQGSESESCVRVAPAPAMSPWDFPTMEEARRQRPKPNEVPRGSGTEETRGKKRRDSIHIDLLNLIKTQPRRPLEQRGVSHTSSRVQKREIVRYTGNQLDSSNPERKRGKKKEVPKKKKLTVLKSAILEQRTLRRRLKELRDNNNNDGDEKADREVLVLSQSMQKSKPSPHSRRFREYCDNMLTPALNTATKQLLKDVVRFQDRQYQRDPIKAFARRRYVSGLREVRKLLQLHRLKLLVIAPDLEAAEGIDHAVAELKALAADQGVTHVFALSRRELGCLSFKKVGVSCIGVCSYEGSEVNFAAMTEALMEARTLYQQETGCAAPLDVSNETKKPNVTDQVIASLLSKLTVETVDTSPFLSAIEGTNT
ncbi:titin homolog [Periplaneta americana]|uniref:titin homolog n=1 Tax=Periplaneta americana TaxID=6978 RepID=UPI0037E8E148